MEGMEIINMNKFETQPLVATWLIAREEDKPLHNVMEELAGRFEAPKFIPHLTMRAVQVPLDRVEEAKSVVRRIAHTFKPITLKVSGVGYADNLFQSLFLKFEESPELNDLYQTIERVLEEYGDYSFEPHLSLLYKELPEEKKKRLIPTIQLPSTVTFDRLGINVHLDERRRLDIENWRIEIL